jgi:hypothetical protein
MPSARNLRASDTLPLMRTSRSVAWPLFKAGLLWFLFGLVSSRLAMALGSPPYSFALFATLAFVVHVAIVWLRVALLAGVTARLRVSMVVCFVFGLAMFTMLRQSDNALLEVGLGALRLTERGTRTQVTTDSLFERMRPPEHLVAANKLIFTKGTQQAIDEARQHLVSISPRATEYKNAQALLHVADTRLNEFETPTRQNGEKTTKRPIHVVSREQTNGCFQATFRNIGEKDVRRIRYKVAYFRVADGWHVEPDKQSMIVDAVPPLGTRTVEVCDDVLTTHDFYAFFSVVGWEVVPTS